MSAKENSNELSPHYAELAAALPTLFTIGNQQVSAWSKFVIYKRIYDFSVHSTNSGRM
jgi:hypothetical protein